MPLLQFGDGLYAPEQPYQDGTPVPRYLRIFRFKDFVATPL
jgi:hypothetical protein